MFKGGIISYQHFTITVDCVIRDQSEGGVKLKIEDRHFIPNRFHLVIPVDGVRAECEVRWRNGQEIGAVFVGGLETDPLMRSLCIPSNDIALHLYVNPEDSDEERSAQTLFEFAELQNDSRGLRQLNMGPNGIEHSAEGLLSETAEPIMEDKILEFMNRFVKERDAPWRTRRPRLPASDEDW